IHTLPAKDVVPADHPRNLGVIGEFGTETAAEAFAQADVVLVVGSTWWQPDYVPDARFIQIDRSPRHVGMLFPVDVGLVGGAAQVLPQLLDQTRPRRSQAWERLVEDLKSSWERSRHQGDAAVADPAPLVDGDGGDGGVAPHQVVAALQE